MRKKPLESKPIIYLYSSLYYFFSLLLERKDYYEVNLSKYIFFDEIYKKKFAKGIDIYICLTYNFHMTSFSCVVTYVCYTFDTCSAMKVVKHVIDAINLF